MHNILLIGETGIDQWVVCEKLRPSPEAPSLVGSGDVTIENPGLAANVAENLRRLGGGCVDVRMATNETPIVKRRYIDPTSRHVIFRWDGEDRVSPEEAIKSIDGEIGVFDAIVVSSYDKGLVDQVLLAELFREARSQGVPTFADFKWHMGPWSRDLFCAKINEKEFQNHDSISEIDGWCQNLVVTKGPDGAVWYGHKSYPGVEVPKVASVAGCGDTFLAALVVRYLDTWDLDNSIIYANKAAAFVVGKDGVYAPTSEEVNLFSCRG